MSHTLMWLIATTAFSTGTVFGAALHATFHRCRPSIDEEIGKIIREYTITPADQQERTYHG